MSLITLAVLFTGFFALLTILVAIAPSAAQYPVPDFMLSSIGTISGYIATFASIFPHTATTLILSFKAMMLVGFLVAVWTTIRYFIGTARGSHI